MLSTYIFIWTYLCGPFYVTTPTVFTVIILQVCIGKCYRVLLDREKLYPPAYIYMANQLHTYIGKLVPFITILCRAQHIASEI